MVSEILEAMEDWREAKNSLIEAARRHMRPVKEMYYPVETCEAEKEIRARRAVEDALDEHITRLVKNELHILLVNNLRLLQEPEE